MMHKQASLFKQYTCKTLKYREKWRHRGGGNAQGGQKECGKEGKREAEIKKSGLK